MRSTAVNILDLAKRNVDAIRIMRLKNLDPLDYTETERESPDGPVPPDATIAIKVVRYSQESPEQQHTRTMR